MSLTSAPVTILVTADQGPAVDMTSPTTGTYYSLWVTATDRYGCTGTSTTNTSYVLNPPTIVLTSPTNGATFTAGLEIPATVTATFDSTHTTASVTCYCITNVSYAGIAAASSPTSPFSATWALVPTNTIAAYAQITDILAMMCVSVCHCS